MSQRVDYVRVEPKLGQALGALHSFVRSTALDKLLLHLIDIRVSQINGCAYCLDLHCQEARADGETQQRLDVLAGWRETDLFDTRERAVLNFTEHVTRISTDRVPDEVYEAVRAQFSEQEVLQVLGAIISINSWTRVAITTGRQPKHREPALT